MFDIGEQISLDSNSDDNDSKSFDSEAQKDAQENEKFYASRLDNTNGITGEYSSSDDSIRNVIRKKNMNKSK